ncbi:M56 family metallopeptidase [Streptomyces sp. NPDC012637]|uniref:M56 family metallopeptidase n=1 Tax=Streptomyces sp. NPDC012637 TaxID=3364842 RepID=UPI0036E78D38
MTFLAVTASVRLLADHWYRSTPPEFPAPGTECWEVLQDVFRAAGRPSWPTDLLAARERYPGCFQADNPLPLPPGTFAVLLLLTVCLAGYLAGPYVRIRWRRLVRAEGLPEIGAELTGLAGLAGVRVRFLVDARNPRVSGVAFGHAGRRHVLLDRGLVRLFHTDRPAFRAIVLHELAHVRNRDVDVAHLTVLLWRAYVALFLLPAVFFAFDQLGTAIPTPYAKLSFWLQLAVLAVAVLLGHNGIVRERELSADARVARWGAGDDLARVLTGNAARAQPLGTRPKDRLRHLAALHPHPARRARALADPSALPHGRWSGQLGTGLILGLTAVPVAFLVSDALTAVGLRDNLASGPALAVPLLSPATVPLGGALALTLWHMAAAADRPLAWLRCAGAGLACGGGVAAAELLVSEGSPQGPVLSPLPAGVRLAYAGALFAGFALLTLWLMVSARLWPPRLAAGPYVGAAAGAALLTGWLPLTYGLRWQPDFEAGGPSATMAKYVAGVWPSGGWAVACAVVLVGVPAAGAMTRAVSVARATAKDVMAGPSGPVPDGSGPASERSDPASDGSDPASSRSDPASEGSSEARRTASRAQE